MKSSANRREKGQKQGKVHDTHSEAFAGCVADSGGDESHTRESTNEGPEVFEGLCERMLSALCLLQTSVSEVLDVKDELILQNVPSSVQTQLSLCTSRLFRSLSDLYVPSTELVRLVRVFGTQWEQKRLLLNQLQQDHERLQRLLSLALKRVQRLEAQDCTITTLQELGEAVCDPNAHRTLQTVSGNPWRLHKAALAKTRAGSSAVHKTLSQ